MLKEVHVSHEVRVFEAREKFCFPLAQVGRGNLTLRMLSGRHFNSNRRRSGSVLMKSLVHVSTATLKKEDVGNAKALRREHGCELEARRLRI